MNQEANLDLDATVSRPNGTVGGDGGGFNLAFEKGGEWMKNGLEKFFFKWAFMVTSYPVTVVVIWIVVVAGLTTG